MRRSSRSMAAAARALAPGLLVVAPAAGAVVEASIRESWATLGRDQGIFQYIAWANAQGDVLYRDVRDVNGPLIPLLHRMAQALGGADEHRFRVLDLLITAVVTAFVGACLAALDQGRITRGWEGALRALGLGVAAWAVLTAQYLGYGFWDTAQRESFLDWFVLVSIGLQIVGQTMLHVDTSTAPGRRIGMTLLMLSGAASVMPWFGKPTYVLFTIGQLLALAVDDLVLTRVRRTALVAVGGVGGALVPVGYLFACGDPRAWARITFVDVPAMYRFIWPRPFSVIMKIPGYDMLIWFAISASLVIMLLVVTKVMPRRALTLAVMPLAGLASVAIQAKGFGYHFHPVSMGVALVLVAIAHHAWVHAERSRRLPGYIAAGLVVLGLGVRTSLVASQAFYPPVPERRDAASLESVERLAPYDRIDFFPHALRAAAAHVASQTAPHETVQAYGMDPYLLFLARRRSATPYIYAYDLDVDAALAGGSEEGSPRPTEAQRAFIVGLRDDHERDMLARMKAQPPAAIVFVDRSPLMRSSNSQVDFEQHCPTSWAWVLSSYRESAAFDGVHVWLPVVR